VMRTSLRAWPRRREQIAGFNRITVIGGGAHDAAMAACNCFSGITLQR